MVMTQNESEQSTAMGTLLAAYVVQQTQGTLAANSTAALDLSAQRVHQSGLPLGEALLMLTGRRAASEAASVLELVRSESPTIDRSLTLLWAYRALSGGRTSSSDALLRSTMARIELDAPWQQVETATGQRTFRWPTATAVPTSIKLATAPVAGLTAVAQFDSREPEKTNLPVQVERRIYRLVRDNSPADNATASGGATDGSTYLLELLPANAALKTDEVYLDEVMLKQTGGAPLRFGIVEVPLPPGSTADRTTWGIHVQFPESQSAEALEHARYEQTPRGYAVPVDSLNGTLTIRHLIRAAQTGKFLLPPVRYYRMYQPEQKAFEEKPRASIEIR